MKTRMMGQSLHLLLLAVTVLLCLFRSTMAQSLEQDAEIKVYAGSNFDGKQEIFSTSQADLKKLNNFANQIASVDIKAGRWRFCTAPNMRGKCDDVCPGKHVLPLAQANITLFEHPGFRGVGRTFTSEQADLGFLKNRVSSFIVHSGTWTFFRSSNYFNPMITVGSELGRQGRPWEREGVSGFRNEDVDSISCLKTDTSSLLLLPEEPMITLFDQPDFKGNKQDFFADDAYIRGFSDKARSVIVHSGTWEVFAHSQFNNDGRRDGWRYKLTPGYYENHRAMGTNRDMDIGSLRIYARNGLEEPPSIRLYSDPGFGGQSLVITEDSPTLPDGILKNQVDSVVVVSGVWRLHANENFGGNSIELGYGEYANLDAFGLSLNTVESVELVRP